MTNGIDPYGSWLVDAAIEIAMDDALERWWWWGAAGLRASGAGARVLAAADDGCPAAGEHGGTQEPGGAMCGRHDAIAMASRVQAALMELEAWWWATAVEPGWSVVLSQERVDGSTYEIRVEVNRTPPAKGQRR